ncbi:FG-GAP repeat domain-containing protein [Aquiflexum sp.]|uniref:FG-GAP repeat domain-containing protein n=1 Tax=Aquiflexum sp. TaxID=1872584 RepID=UPI0035930F4C
MIDILYKKKSAVLALLVCILIAGFSIDRNFFSGNSDDVKDQITWEMHAIDPMPSSGSDGVKLADVNGNGFPDLVTGFEEGGVSRIYINPGPDKVKQYWEYVELRSPDVEDALLVDLDYSGTIDLVTASEGATNQIIFHWAPQRAEDYLVASKWQSEIVPATDDMSAWMFVVPADMDGVNGMDLIVGSKRKNGESGNDKAMVGWLKCPENPREIEKWEYFPLTKAGWIMSMVVVDMNGNGKSDILITDRKFSTQTGVRWLENPGNDKPEFFQEWKSHLIGVQKGEPMFLDFADLNGDGLKDIVVPDLYNGLVIFEQTKDPEHRWKQHMVPYPDWAGPRGKAVAVADINKDGKSDIVLSFEEEGKVATLPYEEYKSKGKHSVIWGSYQDDPFSGNWDFLPVSGLQGRKFDLVNLIDLDLDGYLDVLTNDENEEGDGLGVVWYENPYNREKTNKKVDIDNGFYR